MTNFQDKIRQLPEVVQEAIFARKGISQTQASAWHTCPLQAKFRYIDKLPMVISDAIRYGNIADALVEGWEADTEGIDASLIEHIRLSTDAFASFMNDPEVPPVVPEGARRYMQLPVYAPLDHGWYAYGFLDDLWVPTSDKCLLVDRKMSGKPWYDGKVKYYHNQGCAYIWMLTQMGYSVDTIWFVAMNMVNTEVQPFKYRPTRKKVLATADWFNEAVAIRESGVYKPDGGHHCGICDYKDECDKELWGKGLTNPDS